MTDYVSQDDVNFSTWLEINMNKHNICASDVARGIEVNRSTISLWRSEKQSPRAEYVSRLAVVFSELKTSEWLKQEEEKVQTLERCSSPSIHEIKWYKKKSQNNILNEILFSVHVSEMRRSR